jgi:hypothetical protein
MDQADQASYHRPGDGATARPAEVPTWQPSDLLGGLLSHL